MLIVSYGEIWTLVAAVGRTELLVGVAREVDLVHQIGVGVLDTVVDHADRDPGTGVAV